MRAPLTIVVSLALSLGCAEAEFVPCTPDEPSCDAGMDAAAGDSGAPTSDAGEQDGGRDAGVSDVDAGPCGPCEAPRHGSAECVGTECLLTCSSPYAAVTRDGRTYCSSFGGVFLTRDGDDSCVFANPFTEECSCPSGFSVETTAWRYDGGDGTLGLCSGPRSTSPLSDWGGFYAYQQGGACVIPNPLRPALACTCHGGTVSSGWRGSYGAGTSQHVVVEFCGAEPALTEPFAGAWTDGMLACGGCRNAVAATGACACPDGATALSLPTVLDDCTEVESTLCLSM